MTHAVQPVPPLKSWLTNLVSTAGEAKGGEGVKEGCHGHVAVATRHGREQVYLTTVEDAGQHHGGEKASPRSSRAKLEYEREEHLLMILWGGTLTELGLVVRHPNNVS